VRIKREEKYVEGKKMHGGKKSEKGVGKKKLKIQRRGSPHQLGNPLGKKQRNGKCFQRKTPQRKNFSGLRGEPIPTAKRKKPPRSARKLFEVVRGKNPGRVGK